MSEKLEVARYLRDLATRLLDYPTDHYKEAYEALIAWAQEHESDIAGDVKRLHLRQKPCPQDEANHNGCATCESEGFIYVVDERQADPAIGQVDG